MTQGKDSKKLEFGTDFDHINKGIEQRYELYRRAYASLRADSQDKEADSISLLERLAATDVFVEKAQYHLTERGTFNVKCACVLLTITALIGLCFVVYADRTALSPDFLAKSSELAGWSFALIIIQKLIIGSVFLAGMYLTATFARALLHEATVLFSRRHALRFGRLYVYLSDGKIISKDLFEAFGWNITPSTAFNSVKPETVTKGLVSQVADTVRKAVKKD